jgi:hypothetical protein
VPVSSVGDRDATGMPRVGRLGARVLIAGLLVLLGGLAPLFFGGQIPMCLGPLGVTGVQCARATGILPNVGVGLPVLALTILVATFVVAPVPAGRRLPVLAGGIIGGAIGGAAFFARRPLTMEGFDSTGTWISIPRPVDTYALTTAVVVGALLGAIVLRRVSGVRRVRLRRS